jgi:hypothetical protein
MQSCNLEASSWATGCCQHLSFTELLKHFFEPLSFFLPPPWQRHKPRSHAGGLSRSSIVMQPHPLVIKAVLSNRAMKTRPMLLRMLPYAFVFTALLAATAVPAAVARALKGVGSISTGMQCDDLDQLNISWYYNWKAAPDCPVMIPCVSSRQPQVFRAHTPVLFRTCQRPYAGPRRS